MKHQFQKSENGMCGICQRDILSHTSAAKCDKCSARGVCDVIGALLLCTKCAEQQVIAEIKVDETIHAPQPTLIETALRIQNNIHTSGDFFNAATVPIIELKKEIELDATLSADQKHHKLCNLVADRIIDFKEKLFAKQNEVHELQINIAAHQHALREFGLEVTKEARARLAEADAKYQPAKPTPVKTKAAVKSKASSPLDKVAAALAALHGISKESALEQLKSGRLGGKEIGQKVSDLIDKERK